MKAECLLLAELSQSRTADWSAASGTGGQSNRNTHPGGIRTWLHLFEVVDFIVLGIDAQLRSLLTDALFVEEAQTAAAVMVSGQRTLPSCPIAL